MKAQSELPLVPQSTVTGQRPGCVEEPTFQRQVVFVPDFGPRPCACETVVS